ncbi:ATP-dependent helicase [Pseudomonas syringae]|nr:ATP-dependent helicase [Pseudomonas syringae]
MGLPAMTVHAFTGGAGCGKTYMLMASLSAYLDATPLHAGQKVLALTFMHGSRRRLEERLGMLQNLRGRAECTTIDSFAWRLVRRWRSLAAALGFVNIEPSEYERVCEAASALVQIKEVQGWVVATFPILVVDEAQDMTVDRLCMVAGLSKRLEVFVAADEFQCLSEKLRPNPACVWLSQVCAPEELTQPRRTNVDELLNAARAIRAGEAPKPGKYFVVAQTPKPPLAGAWINSNLSWYGGGKSVAIITPTLGTFARAALTWAAANKTKKGAGPYSIPWEQSEAKAATEYLATIQLANQADASSIAAVLVAAGDARVARDVTEWLEIQRRTKAKVEFSRNEVVKLVEQSFAQRRQSRRSEVRGWKGMTVHGAKNREFDNVIVLWPAAVGGSDEQKRRLLYNAVTRAKERCIVLVQATAHIDLPPFT